MSLHTFTPVMLISAIALAACGGSNTEVPPAKEPVAKVEPAAMPAATTAEPETNPFEALPAPYNSADFRLGKRIFKQCSSCHILKEGGGNLVGPNLYGMFSRGVGEADGFGYSKALEEADFQWTPEQLDGWLADPRGFLAGNNMSFSGIRKEDQRLAVIAYIMSETGYETPE